jgi:PAS domain S-box-containing protein
VPSFWELYKWYAIGLVAAVIIEALLIVLLLFTRARRRQAEKENERLGLVAEAERKQLSEVVSNVPGIVWEARVEPGSNASKTTFISDYVEKMLGYTAAEWMSEPSGFGLSLMPDDEDRQQAIRNSEAVISSGREDFTQFRWTTKDGRTLWVESYISPIIDDDETVVGLRGVTLDVSARKQGEEMLRRKQAELSGIIESAMDAIITVDESQKILLFNAAAERVFECSATEAIGQPLERFIPRRLREAHRNHISVVGEEQVTRRGVQTDLWGLRASGEEFSVEASISQIEVDGEKFYTVILRDVTQRRLAEQVLRESEERFGKAFRANPQPMSLTTVAEGRYVDVNDSFLAMSGYTRDEVIGHTSLELKVWDAAKTRSDFVQHLSEQGSAVNVETRFHTKDGSQRVLLSSAESLDIAGEKCLLMASSDITERKESEEALRSAHEEVSRLKNQLEEENIYLREEINLELNFGEMVGASDALKYVLFKIAQVGPTESTVLISGETGTGKELVARAIHNASDRRDRPLVKVNCGALSASLIESELFGHEKGAFTGAATRKVGRFELANGATIFLDEIGELPPELQVKLLRVIQEGEFERLGSSTTIKADVRIIAATNRNLDLEVKKGTFREDLWYRLNVFPISVPPLRQRREDIPLLVQHFASRFSRKLGKEITSVSPATLKRLRDYSWPGNVRELANVIERAAISSQGSTLRIGGEFTEPGADKLQTTKTLDELEREHILRIVNETGWRIEGRQGAARILAINPSTLRARMVKLGIQKPG